MSDDYLFDQLIGNIAGNADDILPLDDDDINVVDNNDMSHIMQPINVITNTTVNVQPTNVASLSNLLNNVSNTINTDLLTNLMSDWNKVSGVENKDEFKDIRPDVNAYNHDLPSNKQFCLDSFDLISQSTLKQVYNLINADINNNSDKQLSLVLSKPAYFCLYNTSMQYEDIKKVIELDPMQIAFVYKPDKEMQTIAVKKNGLAIQFIDKPSNDIIKLAVAQNCEAVNYIDFNGNEEAEIDLLVPLCKSYQIKEKYPFIKKPSQLMDIWMIWIQATEEVRKKRILTTLEEEIDVACRKRCDIQYTFPALFENLIKLNEWKIIMLFLELDNENVNYLPDKSLSYDLSVRYLSRYMSHYQNGFEKTAKYLRKCDIKYLIEYMIKYPGYINKFSFNHDELMQIVKKKPVALKIIKDKDFLMKMINLNPINISFVDFTTNRDLIEIVKLKHPSEYEMYSEIHKNIDIVEYGARGRFGGL